ncbi:MAG: ABC transporter substrate-binding protein [Alphaproteobacteria bacterium]|nr:ABC transporter substrate-binding protein [Alphaproteobacteria bacterium]
MTKKTTPGHRWQAVLLAIFIGLLCRTAAAATFRWANDGDPNSMDPYARQETFLLSFDMNMYEPLVRRDDKLALEPGLATGWKAIDPTTWRFTLRQGVRFHDGTPFTSDDVVFSWGRAVGPGSNIGGALSTVKEVRKIDDYTVDFITNGPNPILPDYLTTLAMMSKTWCTQHNATHAADLTKEEENYAARNENGTGPFILRRREPDVETVLAKNPDWWDAGEHPVGIDEAVFTRIQNAVTRVSALLSSELDMIYTVPPQDIERIAATPGMKIWRTAELRTLFLGMDQERPELLESNIKGKNPFKDRRVRQAVYQAIDEEAIAKKVMRGYAHPTGLLIGPKVNGYDPALDTRYPYDPAAARNLLAEAGYPEGFELGMDCPNNRYVNDEAICEAVVAMLARVGIKVDLRAQTRAKFFAKINGPRYETSFYLLGWTPATYDGLDVLDALAATRRAGSRDGFYNFGSYSNPQVDKLIRDIQGESDAGKRRELIGDALRLVRDDVAYIPLHQQVVVWASRDAVDLAQGGDNYFQLRYVRLK